MQVRISSLIESLKPQIRFAVLAGLILLLFWGTIKLSSVYLETKPGSLVRLDELNTSFPIAENIEAAGDKVQLVKASITGAVGKPGVYELADGSVNQDLINLAGGFTRNADLIFVSKEINLAATVKNNSQLYIPQINEQTLLKSTSQSTSPTSPATSSKININSAPKSKLEELPGIGSATADKIIAGRPYATIEDLDKVSGIGESTLEKLKDLIEV